jgi:hypothetical protein
MTRISLHGTSSLKTQRDGLLERHDSELAAILTQQWTELSKLVSSKKFIERGNFTLLSSPVYLRTWLDQELKYSWMCAWHVRQSSEIYAKYIAALKQLDSGTITNSSPSRAIVRACE